MNQLVKFFSLNDNGAKYKKKRVENTAYLEKNDTNELIHELITGGH